MIKGIIFDLDGTLVRLPIKYDIIFKKLGILFDTKDEFKPLITTILAKANNDVNLIQQAFDLICDEETIAANNFEVIDGAIEILDHFKNENFSLGLVTMQCKKAAKLVLDSMNISNHFSSIITRDDSHERTIQIKKSFEFLSLSPQEIVVISGLNSSLVSKIFCNFSKIISYLIGRRTSVPSKSKIIPLIIELFP